MKRTISIVLLLGAFCSASFAVIFMTLDAPQDDRQARQGVWDRPELKPIGGVYSEIIQTRLWPLKLDGIAKIFGPKLDKQPDDMVLPLFAGDGLGLSGLGIGGTNDHTHVDFHAVGDIGYVECFYQINGTSIATAVFYFRADDKFVPLKSTNDFSKRLEWDKPKFEDMQRWLDQHMPKIIDLGVVEVLASGSSRVDLGSGTACIIRTRDIQTANVPFWFSLDVAKDTTNSDERSASRQWRSTSRPNQSIGFSIDGNFYRLTPEFVDQLHSTKN